MKLTSVGPASKCSIRSVVANHPTRFTIDRLPQFTQSSCIFRSAPGAGKRRRPYEGTLQILSGLTRVLQCLTQLLWRKDDNVEGLNDHEHLARKLCGSCVWHWSWSVGALSHWTTCALHRKFKLKVRQSIELSFQSGHLASGGQSSDVGKRYKARSTRQAVQGK